MEKLVETGKVKEIGVSNFMIKKIERLLLTAKITRAVNQVEVRPYLPEHELLQYCESKNIHVATFSPLGGKPVGAVAPNAHIPGPLLDQTVIELAERRNLTPAQVLLKWGLQRRTSVIPKAYGLQHMVDNFAVQELPDLSAEDMLQINAAESGQGEVRYVNAANHWGFDIYNPGNPDASEEV